MSLHHTDMLSTGVKLEKLQIPPHFNTYLVISKYVTALTL
jgi:hypothetical protein